MSVFATNSWRNLIQVIGRNPERPKSIPSVRLHPSIRCPRPLIHSPVHLHAYLPSYSPSFLRQSVFPLFPPSSHLVLRKQPKWQSISSLRSLYLFLLLLFTGLTFSVAIVASPVVLMQTTLFATRWRHDSANGNHKSARQLERQHRTWLNTAWIMLIGAINRLSVSLTT